MSSVSRNLTSVITDWPNNGSVWYTDATGVGGFTSSGTTIDIPTNCTISSAVVTNEYNTTNGNANASFGVFSSGSGVGSGSGNFNSTPVNFPVTITATPTQLNTSISLIISLNSIDAETFFQVPGYPVGGVLSVVFTMAAPTATTSAATDVTLSSATLNGTVNPNGATTSFPGSYKFQWGLTTGYGNETTLGTGQTGSSDIPVSAGISGLTGNTTYHYRVVAINGDHTVNGSDMTFVSSEADPVGMAF